MRKDGELFIGIFRGCGNSNGLKQSLPIYAPCRYMGYSDDEEEEIPLPSSSARVNYSPTAATTAGHGGQLGNHFFHHHFHHIAFQQQPGGGDVSALAFQELQPSPAVGVAAADPNEDAEQEEVFESAASSSADGDDDVPWPGGPNNVEWMDAKAAVTPQHHADDDDDDDVLLGSGGHEGPHLGSSASAVADGVTFPAVPHMPSSFPASFDSLDLRPGSQGEAFLSRISGADGREEGGEKSGRAEDIVDWASGPLSNEQESEGAAERLRRLKELRQQQRHLVELHGSSTSGGESAADRPHGEAASHPWPLSSAARGSRIPSAPRLTKASAGVPLSVSPVRTRPQSHRVANNAPAAPDSGSRVIGSASSTAHSRSPAGQRSSPPHRGLREPAAAASGRAASSETLLLAEPAPPPRAVSRRRRRASGSEALLAASSYLAMIRAAELATSVGQGPDEGAVFVGDSREGGFPSASPMNSVMAWGPVLMPASNEVALGPPPFGLPHPLPHASGHPLPSRQAHEAGPSAAHASPAYSSYFPSAGASGPALPEPAADLLAQDRSVWLRTARRRTSEGGAASNVLF